MADTILDVTDNFLTLRRSHTIDNMPGRLLFDLGREVRAFARAYRPPTPESRQLPVYLGGWPSANFHAASHGQLVLSSLLYSGSVVVKDPLADWFSDEQYRNSHALTARAGHLNEDGSPNVVGTRAFLRNVLPAIEALRPLIDAGLVLLVPSESFYLQHSADIGATARTLTERLGQDPAEFARAFRPVEIPVEDTSRGNFVFAPGPERSTQVRDTIAKAMTYFAREYWLATAHGATYTAPFRFEQHVCEQGLSRVLQPRSAVVRAMLRSDLPIYRGLTAPLLKSLHDDDNFAGFREDLHHIYASVPTSGSEREIAAFIADQEQALLEPKLSEARREAERGLLGRVGVAASGPSSGFQRGFSPMR